MRMAIVAAVLGAVFLLSDARPSRAEVFYPWCAHYGLIGSGGGSGTCGFTSYRQCMATVSGTGGYCARNPFYQRGGYYEERPRRRRRVIIEE